MAARVNSLGSLRENTSTVCLTLTKLIITHYDRFVKPDGIDFCSKFALQHDKICRSCSLGFECIIACHEDDNRPRSKNPFAGQWAAAKGQTSVCFRLRCGSSIFSASSPRGGGRSAPAQRFQSHARRMDAVAAEQSPCRALTDAIPPMTVLLIALRVSISVGFFAFVGWNMLCWAV